MGFLMKKKRIACSFEMDSNANGRIQLFPFGRFYPSDGRDEGKGGWYVNDENGYLLAHEINQSAVDLMVDYEHQTLYSEINGKPNPAAGWIKRAEYRSGEGLFADVEWTEKARQQIKSKAYRYISPLFIPDSDGKVVKVLNAALTNRPALHNLAEAIALSTPPSNTKDSSMLELLRKLLDNPNATEAEAISALTALSAEKDKHNVALSEVYAKLASKDAEIVALSAQKPDATQYVALSELKAVQDQLVALNKQLSDKEADNLVAQALSDGRLLPAQKEWATKLGKSNLAALSEFLSATPEHKGLTDNQANNPPTGGKVALSDAEKAAARTLGMSEEELIQSKTAEKEK